MTHVSDPSDLRSAMASYYDFFSEDNDNDNVIFSVPYFDGFGIGTLWVQLLLPWTYFIMYLIRGE